MTGVLTHHPPPRSLCHAPGSSWDLDKPAPEVLYGPKVPQCALLCPGHLRGVRDWLVGLHCDRECIVVKSMSSR